MKHIEYEERVLITESDYHKVIDDITKEGLPYTESFIVNVYLDNNDGYIKNNKRMLRVRTTNNKDVELTLKIKNKDGSCVEINEEVEKHPLIDKELGGSLDGYHEVAKLITERIEVQYDDYLLVIDKNSYHGKIDYDIEIEAKSQQKAYKIIQNYCKKYNLVFKDDYKSKSHRAILEAEKNRR